MRLYARTLTSLSTSTLVVMRRIFGLIVLFFMGYLFDGCRTTSLLASVPPLGKRMKNETDIRLGTDACFIGSHQIKPISRTKVRKETENANGLVQQI